MASVSSLRSKKSTTGRFIPWLTGRALGALGAALPAVADDLSADLFCRPHRGPLPREPFAPNLDAHRFDLPVAGRRLAVWDWGSGPTVLLVHGWNGHAGQLSPFVAPLVAAGHYVVTFDLPAHGRSEGGLTNIPEMAAAIRGLAERLGPVRAVIAHSLGATATAVALHRGLRAERAVLLSPAAEMPPFLATFASALDLSAPRARGLRTAMERRVGPIEGFDLRRLAPALRTPLFVLHDVGDREVPFAHGKAVAEAAPVARFEALSGLGHRRLLADEGVIRAVVEFVRGGRGSVERRAG
jgi:pimeloyl-ACP methyl ester carboxylesterase